jgi:hypothetical protein
MNLSLLLFLTGVVVILLMLYGAYWSRKKQQGVFKIIIENGYISSHTEIVPAEFLYDVEQIARIEKLPRIVINGVGIKTSSPRLIFKGELSQQLREKFQQSLTLSLQ